MVSIQLDNTSLQFRVRLRRRVPWKEFVIHGLFSSTKNPYREINALAGINLRLHEGERLGIIGRNGAGKSTLLKLLAGIYPPTAGSVTVAGRISSLLDLGIGFEPEANGWDNMRYRGFLQGDTPAQVRHKRQAIADFSELGSALDMPVRFYSSGMLVRLMFAIATAIEPEILLVDEILAAGDLSFREKASRRMLDLFDRARLLVLASHDLALLKRLCTRVLWLDHGRTRCDGQPAEVITQYQQAAQAGQRWAA